MWFLLALTIILLFAFDTPELYWYKIKNAITLKRFKKDVDKPLDQW